jgi:ATP-dependent DNA ligase
VNERRGGYDAIVYGNAYKLGCERIVSKRLGSIYRSRRTAHGINVKHPNSLSRARRTGIGPARNGH